MEYVFSISREFNTFISLISLFVLSNKKVVNSRIFMTIGLLSLAHSSANLWFDYFVNFVFKKRNKANSLIKNFFLIFFQIFYNILLELVITIFMIGTVKYMASFIG